MHGFHSQIFDARIFGAQWSMRHVGLMYSWSQCDKYLPKINGRRTGMCREAKNQTFNFDYYFGNVNNGIWQNNTYQKKACCLIYLLRNLQVKRTDFGHFYFIPKKMCRHKRKKWYKKKKRLLTCTLGRFRCPLDESTTTRVLTITSKCICGKSDCTFSSSTAVASRSRSYDQEKVVPTDLRRGKLQL